jgi:ABC-type phosphate/phosphonate transport system substrate-binding protein
LTLFVPGLLTLLTLPLTAGAQPAKIDTLRIGIDRGLTGSESDARASAGMESLKAYIKEETGLDNDIVRQKSWREVAEQLAGKKLHLGVFEGYQFAWAREKYSDLKPLAVAVNVELYPVACVVAQSTDAATDFVGLRGHSLAVPATGRGFPRLFMERQSDANGQKLEAFFSKLTTPDNVEEALDDLVDGKLQAVVVERAALEAYKRRKPGRFKRLKEVVQSKPFPPSVVAAYGAVLDDATLKRFQNSLLGASRNEKGQTLLTLFHLTGFQSLPAEFERVLADTRKDYPAPK